MAAIDRIALRERVDAGRARIAMLGATDHVVKQALAHRRLADAHLLDVERGETGFEDRDAAGEHAGAVLGESGQAQLVDAAARDERIANAPSATRVMPVSHQPAACATEPIALTVPDEPIVSLQPCAR